jgi:hypothetical protein
VPAHMPHMIDREAIADLQSWYPAQFELTSSHRFRSGHDMQFSFSYFYFLMQEPTGESHEQFLKSTIDLDHNEVLSPGELRVLGTYIYPTITEEDLNELFWHIVDKDMVAYGDKKAGMAVSRLFFDAFAPPSKYAKLKDKTLGPPDKDNVGPKPEVIAKRRSALLEIGQHGGLPFSMLLKDSAKTSPPKIASAKDSVGRLASSAVAYKLEKALENVPKYKHETGDTTADVAFHMVGDKEEEVRKQIDSIWRQRPYFVCVNDNMNKTGPNPKVIDALHEFYTTLFPTPSQFELPAGETNPVLHVDEMLPEAENTFTVGSLNVTIPWRQAGILVGIGGTAWALWACVMTTFFSRNRQRQGRFSRVMNSV